MQAYTSSWLRENSGLQLTISPTLLSPMLLPVVTPSGWVASLHEFVELPDEINLVYIFFKNFCSRRPAAFPESRFQCATVFLPLLLHLVVSYAQPKTFRFPYNY